jgi:hypothetical protein
MYLHCPLKNISGRLQDEKRRIKKVPPAVLLLKRSRHLREDTTTLLKKQFFPRLVKNIRMQGARNQEE